MVPSPLLGSISNFAFEPMKPTTQQRELAAEFLTQLQQLLLFILSILTRLAKATPEDYAATYERIARAVAPAIAATYVAGYEAGCFIRSLSERLPRLLRRLGVNA